MVVTEEEAHRLLCHYGMINYGEGSFGRNCEASGCMAWVWERSREEVRRDIDNETFYKVLIEGVPKRGYCGLVHRG